MSTPSPSKERFYDAYDGVPPWEVGRPQPALVALIDEVGVKGSALDVGCGTGEHALYLASRGVSAWGLDAAPRAIEIARDKAKERGLNATFVVGDALDLGALGRSFDAIIDSGLFHLFTEEEREAYVDSVADALTPGGDLLLLGFSDEEPERGPRGFDEKTARELLSRRFDIVSLRPARFASRRHDEGALAWQVHARKR